MKAELKAERVQQEMAAGRWKRASRRSGCRDARADDGVGLVEDGRRSTGGESAGRPARRTTRASGAGGGRAASRGCRIGSRATGCVVTVLGPSHGGVARWITFSTDFAAIIG